MGESLESFKKQKKYLKNAHIFISLAHKQIVLGEGLVGKQKKNIINNKTWLVLAVREH